jgi:hypothetical protein
MVGKPLAQEQRADFHSANTPRTAQMYENIAKKSTGISAFSSHPATRFFALRAPGEKQPSTRSTFMPRSAQALTVFLKLRRPGGARLLFSPGLSAGKQSRSLSGPA